MTTTQLPKPLINSMNNDPIADALELTPIQEVLPKQMSSVEPIDSDYDFARSNLINVIDKGREALDDMLGVAQMSQQPRAYEVIATLIKTLSDSNKDLLELSKKAKELKKDEDQGPKTVNNNLFVGSTAELQKLLKNNE
jgi:hypothetical protein